MAHGNLVLLGAALAFAAVLFQPRLLRAPWWQATVTPLASIIGSGFLVAAPILAHAAGRLATLAMLGLCTIAYLFGAAIRHNIRHVEPCLGRQPPTAVALLERASDLALSLAYFVSVAYYLNLFAAFGLRLGHVLDPTWIHVTATAAIAVVGGVGAAGGLDALERMTLSAVSLKLALIGGVLSALVVASVAALHAGSFAWPATPHLQDGQALRVLLGLVILVQGFETSRYLGHAYDTGLRIRTMRWAQWLSTGVYLLFVLLATRYFRDGLPPRGAETAIIELLAPLGTALMPIIIATALASQLSAAVADTSGAGGLIHEASGHRLPVKLGYALTAAMAIVITWSADIFHIIVYASKAFVAYYGLQSAQASASAWRQGQRGRAVLFALGVAVALVVIVFAVPAEA